MATASVGRAVPTSASPQGTRTTPYAAASTSRTIPLSPPNRPFASSRSTDMVGGGSSAGSAAGGFYTTVAASETDGETFDGDDGFDDYEEWDYAEMVAALSKNVKTYVLQPLVVGAAAAFGMSIGYAMFDATVSIFSRKGTSPRSR